VRQLNRCVPAGSRRSEAATISLAAQNEVAPKLVRRNAHRMRPLLLLAALLLVPAASAQTLDDLAWLKGCWRTRDPGPVITEVWTAPPMPALLGYSYTQHDGQTQGWEQMRIEMDQGVPAFIAMPNGAPPVRFGMAERATNSIAFENAAHDFPQRVAYRRDGDTLTATISRLGDDDLITFTYRRIRCAPELRP
jgi:hypothetical protein